jgi:hypothetical protein
MDQTQLLRRIRICLATVVAGLVFSGVTAFPLVAKKTQRRRSRFAGCR